MDRVTPEPVDIERWIDDGGYTDWLREALDRADDLWEFFREDASE